MCITCQCPPDWVIIDQGEFLCIKFQRSSTHHHDCYNKPARAGIMLVLSAFIQVGQMEQYSLFLPARGNLFLPKSKNPGTKPDIENPYNFCTSQIIVDFLTSP